MPKSRTIRCPRDAPARTASSCVTSARAGARRPRRAVEARPVVTALRITLDDAAASRVISTESRSDLAVEQRAQVSETRRALGDEPRIVARREALDQQVFDDQAAAPEVERQAADVHGPVDEVGRLALGPAAAAPGPRSMVTIDDQRPRRWRRPRPARHAARGAARTASARSTRSPAHRYSTTARPLPRRPTALRATAIAATRPARAARSSFSIFIASTTTRPCRGCHRVARLDEHPHDLAGHRRGDALRARAHAPAAPRRRRAGRSGDRHRHLSAVDVHVERRPASCRLRRRPARSAGRARAAADEQRQQAPSMPRGVHRSGVAVDGDRARPRPPAAPAPCACARRCATLYCIATSAPRRAPAGASGSAWRDGRRRARRCASAACSAAAMAASSSSSAVGVSKGSPSRSASIAVDERGVETPGHEIRIVEHPAEERDRGLDAVHLVFARARGASAPAPAARSSPQAMSFEIIGS